MDKGCDGGNCGSLLFGSVVVLLGVPFTFSLCMLSSRLFASPSSSTTGNVVDGTPFALSGEGLRTAVNVLSWVVSSEEDPGVGL